VLEKAIEKYLVKEVKRIGGISYKFESPGNNGVPDRLVILPKGRVYFIELKRPKNSKTASLQHFQHERLKDLGADVRIVRSIDAVDDFIKEVSHGIQAS